MLASAAGQAQAPPRAAIGNLHDTCLRAVSGKFFDQLDLYRILTKEYGLVEIAAKRISAAFAPSGRTMSSPAAPRGRRHWRANCNGGQTIRKCLHPFAPPA